MFAILVLSLVANVSIESAGKENWGRGCSSALIGRSSTGRKLGQKTRRRSRMHRAGGSQWKCKADTSYG